MHAPCAGIEGYHVLRRQPDDIGCPACGAPFDAAGAAGGIGSRGRPARADTSTAMDSAVAASRCSHQKWISLLSEGPRNSRTVVPSVSGPPPRSADDTSPPQVTPLPAAVTWRRFPCLGGRSAPAACAKRNDRERKVAEPCADHDALRVGWRHFQCDGRRRLRFGAFRCGALDQLTIDGEDPHIVQHRLAGYAAGGWHVEPSCDCVRIRSTRSPGQTRPARPETASTPTVTARMPDPSTAARKPRSPGLSASADSTASPLARLRLISAPSSSLRTASVSICPPAGTSFAEPLLDGQVLGLQERAGTQRPGGDQERYLVDSAQPLRLTVAGLRGAD